MMSQFLRVQSAPNGVITLTLARPEVHNALNAELIAALTQEFQGIAHDTQARAVILAAAGASFCAGADLNEMRAMAGYTHAQNLADAGRLAAMFRAVRGCPVPVLARVQGAAIGGGAGLVAACDMAIALPAAKFGFTEARLGLLPAVIAPHVLEKIGAAHARRYFTTAEVFQAETAQAIGLVSAIADDEALMDDWLDRQIGRILKNGPQAVRACKALITDVMAATSTTDALDALTCQRIAEQRISPEGQEGMQAFLEKRSPAWVTEDGTV